MSQPTPDFIRHEILYRRERDGSPGLWLVGRMKRRLRVVCAWCNRVIREGDPERASHGICPECSEKHFPRGAH